MSATEIIEKPAAQAQPETTPFEQLLPRLEQ
jgi:hypothetical protein